MAQASKRSKYRAKKRGGIETLAKKQDIIKLRILPLILVSRQKERGSPLKKRGVFFLL